MPMKHLYFLLFVSLTTPLFSQCDAEFVSVRDDFTVHFFDRSTGFDDPIYTWSFGDGAVSTAQEPSHLYDAVGAYMVSLTVSDEECSETITKRIEICDLEVNHSFDPICQASLNRLELDISDPSEVLDSVDVYLDGEKLNGSPIALENGQAIYSTFIVGDGHDHTLHVTSTLSTTCNLYKDITPINCVKTCQNYNLEVMPIGNGMHEVKVKDGRYEPEHLDITLGDMVKFTWEADGFSVTSDDNGLGDDFDTGLRNSGYEYFLSIKNPGTHEYGDRQLSFMEGSITTTCPDDNQSRIMLTFTNYKTPEEGFYISVDGFIMYDQVYTYDPSGQTTVDYMLPGDGLAHVIEVYDIETGCTIKDYVSSINCDSHYDCRLRLSYEQLTRCEDDSLAYKIKLDALSTLTESIELYRNGMYLGQFGLEDRYAEQIYTFRGDGELDTIVAYNALDFHCLDSLIFNQRNCSIPCTLGNLELYGAQGNTKVYSVSRETEINEVVYSEVGENIFLQWTDDDQLGMRIVDRKNKTVFDSGLETQGAVYTAPLLTTGRNTFTIYDANGDISDFTLYVVSTCAGSDIAINYSFIDTSGYIDGYNIYIDGNKYNTALIPYQVGGENYGTLYLDGDNKEHNIVIRDSKKYGCSTSLSYFVPSCEPLDCGAELSVIPQDSCYNGDFAFVDISFHHPDPIGDKVDITRDGFSLDLDLFTYDADGNVTITEFLPSDGRNYTYAYQDGFDTSCKDQVVYESVACNTACVFSELKVENVNSAFMVNNPTTPMEYFGCTDSLSYISVSFREKYSDASKYYIFMDERFLGLYDLHPGDTINQVFIQLYGDSKDHLVTVQSTLELDCNMSDAFTAPKCYNPCKIVLDDVIAVSCEDEIATHAIILNKDFNADQIYLELDDERIDFDRVQDTIYFDMKGDGLDHHIEVGSKKSIDEYCVDEIDFTASYCLNCFMDATASLIKSCDEADSVVYRITVNPEFKGRYEVTYKGETTTLNSEVEGTAFDISVLGDGNEATMKFQSLEDVFCKSTLKFERFDCSPIICDPDFTYSFDGYKGTFVDNSTTSEELTSHRWEIGGFLTFSNLNEFSYTFDSISTYEICRFIETDSCSNSICKMVELPDPCKDFESHYEYELHKDTLKLFADIKGEYDDLSYNLGDGSIYSNPELVHIYKEDGIYEVCLTALNEKNRCEDIFCEEINVIISSAKDEFFSNLSIYPNPLDQSSRLHIEHRDVDIDEMDLMTLDGAQLKTRVERGISSSTIKLEDNLSGGLYLLRLRSAGHYFYKKIFIL